MDSMSGVGWGVLALSQSARRKGAQHGLPNVALAGRGARTRWKDAGTYGVMTTYMQKHSPTRTCV